ncbi:MAG: hypothetical protein QOF55_2265 [Thermoleophilaceae bacterium]|nr:hypothetical protein [Thermoleophilaceae bacterium]
MSGSLGDRLRSVEVPDEDAARERARAVARAAFDARERRPAPSLFRRPAVPAFATAALALLLLSFTSPGKAVINSVRDTLGRTDVRHVQRAALERLPAPGSLLVRSPEGPWVVRADGSRRLLGAYLDATWSPQGRFVGVTRQNALLAVEPGGRVHWSLARPRVSDPRWAPTGFRVAYRSGPVVRVVAGDGTGDRSLGRGGAAAWQPLAPGLSPLAAQKIRSVPNLLAVAGAGSRVRLLDVDTRRPAWTSPPLPPRPRTLSWSGDGQRLLVATGRALVLLDGAGRVVRRIAARGRATLAAAAFAPAGRRIAVVRRRGGASELALIEGGRERLLFAGAGQLGGVTWSPDGRWLLVAWPTADEFLFVRTSGPARVEAAQGVAGEFDPRATGVAGDPLPAGWCCTTR